MAILISQKILFILKFLYGDIYMKIKSIQYFIDILRGKEDIDNPHKIVKQLTAGNNFIYQGQDGNDIIAKHLNSDKPEMICRFGSLELDTVRYMLKNNKVMYPRWQKELFSNTAGFFPTDDYAMTRFACEQLEILKDVDVIACRQEKYELKTAELYLEHAHITNIDSITFPFLYNNPWSKYLKGKKVLVINPFDETIKKQYAKRELLFKNTEVLPEFELLTYRPVQGIGNSKKLLPYKTWFEALEVMKNEIKDIDFDIAVIGAGAYGMFLAQYCKSLGKKAVHMGGATQLLFGISGKRWDHWIGSEVYNEHWTRPSKEETPDGVELFEHGTFAYW